LEKCPAKEKIYVWEKCPAYEKKFLLRKKNFHLGKNVQLKKKILPLPEKPNFYTM